MRSIFRDFTYDFFGILNYPKEKWNDFWVVFCKSEFPVFARIPNNFPPGKFVNEFSLANS